MDKSGKFLLPSPKFKNLDTPPSRVRHFLSPEGIQLLPQEQQPPPMYGPRGTTLPPKFLSPLKVPTTNNQFDRNQKYFCEPCEAEFHTSTDYKVHKSEHVQCEIDKCMFRGHPAFMDTHIAQQHATGLYNQLKKLSTPEEIAQWRADRKKNYPTVASVEQKYKAREQRMLRGEKLELQNMKRFGNRADRRQINEGKPTKDNSEKVESNKRKRNNAKNKKQRDRKYEKKKREEVSTTLPKANLSMQAEKQEEPTCGGLRMFKGTKGMADYKKPKKQETNVLSSLLGMYGSDSENDSDNNSEEEKEYPAPEKVESNKIEDDSCAKAPIAHQELETQKAVEESIPQDEATEETQKEVFLTTASESEQSRSEGLEKREETSITSNAPEEQQRDNDGPEEAAISKNTNIPDRPQTEPPRKKTKINPLKRKSALDYRKLRLGRQNTMLEKLLDADIRHERNVLLQCVRFVVQNNFFDKPKSA